MPESLLVGPGLAEFEAARSRVSAVVETTPMESSRYLADILGSAVHLKCENLQRTGSYKIRGAYNRLSLLSDEEKAAREAEAQAQIDAAAGDASDDDAG